MGILKQNIGRRLRELRKSAQISQCTLADAISCDPKTISRVESGQNFPSFELLEKIASHLSCDVVDFFRFTHLKKTELLKKEIKHEMDLFDDKEITLLYKIVKAFRN